MYRRKYKDIILYIAITYILAYTLDLSLYLSYGFLGPKVSIDTSSMAYYILVTLWGFIRMYIPTIATVVILWKNRIKIKQTLKRYINVSSRNMIWYMVAPLIVYLSILIYIIIAYPVGMIDFEGPFKELITQGLPPDVTPTIFIIQLILIILIRGYFSSVSTNAFFAFGEEIGWRGYLYSSFRSDRNPIRSGLIIGVIWGLWHTPVIIIPYLSDILSGLLHLLLYTLWISGVSITLNLLRFWSKSILPTVSLHGGLNAVWGLTLLLSSATEELPYTISQFIGVVAWLATSLILWYVIKWSSRPKEESADQFHTQFSKE